MITALVAKTCDRCGAAVHREPHARTCSTRAEIIRVGFTAEERRLEMVLQACTRKAWASLQPGGRFATLAGRLLP